MVRLQDFINSADIPILFEESNLPAVFISKKCIKEIKKLSYVIYECIHKVQQALYQ